MNTETQFQPSIRYPKKNTDCYLNISFEAFWDFIPMTKDYIEHALLIGTISRDEIHKIGTAASELLENAVKYSSKNGVQIIIKKIPEKNIIELLIYNYADAFNANRLLERVEELNQADPLQYYLHRMKESIRNKDKDAGLGLARIYHEACAGINARYIREESLVEVKVLIPV